LRFDTLKRMRVELSLVGGGALALGLADPRWRLGYTAAGPTLLWTAFGAFVLASAVTIARLLLKLGRSLGQPSEK
jgi:hypothetical protein